MRIGYRRQAKYNHPNGAYSIWGDKVKASEIWINYSYFFYPRVIRTDPLG